MIWRPIHSSTSTSLAGRRLHALLRSCAAACSIGLSKPETKRRESSRHSFRILESMPLRFASVALILAACACPQSPAIPDTAAGHALDAWLGAFNSGDRTRIQAYVTKYEPAKAVDGMLAFHDQTGGFDLVSIEKSEPLHVEFVVKE